MDCNFCGQSVDGMICPSCGHFTSESAEKAARQIAVQIARGKPEGKANYQKLISKVPADQRDALKQRMKADVAHLREKHQRQQQGAAGIATSAAAGSRVSDSAIKPKTKPSATSKSHLPPKQANHPKNSSSIKFQTASVTIEETALTPPLTSGVFQLVPYRFERADGLNQRSKRDVRKITGAAVQFDGKPKDLLEQFDALQKQIKNSSNTHKLLTTMKQITTLGWIASLVIAVMFLLVTETYSPLTAGLLIAFGVLVAARIFLSVVSRFVLTYELHPAYGQRVSTLHTLLVGLQDDIKRNLRGYLDLSGSIKETTVTDTYNTPSGKPVSRYDQVWLVAHGKIFDGNTLTVEVGDKIKNRMKFWKRGRISNKWKRKPGHIEERARLRLRLDVNPEHYHTQQVSSISDNTLGWLNIMAITSDHVDLKGTVYEVDGSRLLNALRYLYGFVVRV